MAAYVDFFNNRRPAAALGYKSPVQYRTELGFC
ncbi:IS3 family transposase [Lawsonibacter celer]